MKTKVLDESPLSLSEVKHILEKSKEHDDELSFRAAKTYDYLANTPVLDYKEVQKLKEELKKLEVSRLKDKYIAKLIDTLPKTADDVKFVLQAYTITISAENREKIAEVIIKATS